MKFIRVRKKVYNYRIKPLTLLEIQSLGALPDLPINSDYLVEPDGDISLGPYYGRVRIGGLTLEEAEKVIDEHLSEILAEPQISVTLSKEYFGKDEEFLSQ